MCFQYGVERPFKTKFQELGVHMFNDRGSHIGKKKLTMG